MYTPVCVRYGSGYTLQAKIYPAMMRRENIPSSSRDSSSLPLESEQQAVSERPSVGATYRNPSGTVAVSRTQGTTDLKHFIEQSFYGARLVEQHQVCVLYHHSNITDYEICIRLHMHTHKAYNTRIHISEHTQCTTHNTHI